MNTTKNRFAIRLIRSLLVLALSVLAAGPGLTMLISIVFLSSHAGNVFAADVDFEPDWFIKDPIVSDYGDTKMSYDFYKGGEKSIEIESYCKVDTDDNQDSLASYLLEARKGFDLYDSPSGFWNATIWSEFKCALSIHTKENPWAAPIKPSASIWYITGCKGTTFEGGLNGFYSTLEGGSRCPPHRVDKKKVITLPNGRNEIYARLFTTAEIGKCFWCAGPYAIADVESDGRSFSAGIKDLTPFPGYLIETDDSWKAIAPPPDQTGLPIDTVGKSWENQNVGWNSDLEYDESGWNSAITNNTKHPPRPDINFIWTSGHGRTGSSPAYFRKTFYLDDVPSSGRLTVLADDSAQVYINGYLVDNDRDCKVQLRSKSIWMSLFRKGWNLIAVKAHDCISWEGLYLSLWVGPHRRVYRPVVDFRASKPGTLYESGSWQMRGNCPDDCEGYYVFPATLTNKGIEESLLSNLMVEIHLLSGDNLLRVQGVGLMGTGDTFPVRRLDDYTDNRLEKGEAVRVPFGVCLKRIEPFYLLVNVLAERIW